MTVPGGYQPSPRPSFAGPAVIAGADATRHVWGDPESGEVLDRIYVSNDRIHQLLFEIGPGGQFTHSASFRTVFGADEVLYAVDGDLVVANPETGQVVRAAAGEAVFFGADTWHHAFNWGTGPVRVLEFFAPPPATGTSGAYAQQRPLLNSSNYSGDGVPGQIIPGVAAGAGGAAGPAGAGGAAEGLAGADAGGPAAGGLAGAGAGGPAAGGLAGGDGPAERRRAGAAARPGRLTVVRPQDYLWRLDGDRAPVLTGIIASTPRLTVVRCEVRGTGWSGWLSQAGDTGGYVLAGTLLLQLDGRAWHELGPGDGFYLPGGQRYQVKNASAGITTYLAGSAPTCGGAVADRGELAGGGAVAGGGGVAEGGAVAGGGGVAEGGAVAGGGGVAESGAPAGSGGVAESGPAPANGAAAGGGVAGGGGLCSPTSACVTSTAATAPPRSA
jgi:quercetin dioxygenase-like cupin family protein